MKLSKKTLAILAGLTIGMSGSAFAASADSFTDVPKDHWAYQALDYLAQEGVIDGMGDSTFQGGRSMTRYEMAAIVAKAMQKNPTNVGDQAVLEKLEGEFGTEIKRLTKRVDAHDKQIKELQAKTDKFKVWGKASVQAGTDNGLKCDSAYDGWTTRHNGDYNNRFYMDLEGAMQVNPHATARFTIEKNARYNDREYWTKSETVADSTGKLHKVNVPLSGELRDMPDQDTNHNGSISNIWVELQLGPKHDWYTNIGRKWNGVSMQNLLVGAQMDGIWTYHPIEHGHGWWFSAQYWKGSSDCTNYNVNFTDPTAVYEQTSWTDANGDTKTGDAYHYSDGTVGHEATKTLSGTALTGKQEGLYSYADGTVGTAATKTLNGSRVQTGTTQSVKNVDVWTRRSPVVGTLNFWGPLGKYVDANVSYSRIVGHKYDANSGNGYWYDTSAFWSADLKLKLFKDFSVIGSYVKAMTNQTGNYGHGDRDLAARIEYRGTDLNKVGSWGLYAKWMNLGAFADLGHDDEWATREPTFTNGVRGWYFGFKCIPAHNVEWETMWAPHLNEQITWNTPEKRHILRSWLDFHF